jgi:DNA-directed RNA polymerase specialized sigma24 family protein
LNASVAAPDGINERAAPDWVAEADRNLDLEKLLSYLTPRSCRTIVLKSMGYTWVEIGKFLKMSTSTARNSFWTDVRQAQFKLLSRQGQKNKG